MLSSAIMGNDPNITQFLAETTGQVIGGLALSQLQAIHTVAHNEHLEPQHKPNALSPHVQPDVTELKRKQATLAAHGHTAANDSVFGHVDEFTHEVFDDLGLDFHPDYGVTSPSYAETKLHSAKLSNTAGAESPHQQSLQTHHSQHDFIEIAKGKAKSSPTLFRHDATEPRAQGNKWQRFANPKETPFKPNSQTVSSVIQSEAALLIHEMRQVGDISWDGLSVVGGIELAGAVGSLRAAGFFSRAGSIGKLAEHLPFFGRAKVPSSGLKRYIERTSKLDYSPISTVSEKEFGYLNQPTLTPAQNAQLRKLNNLIRNHAKPHDFTGVSRELSGIKIPNKKVPGEFHNHVREMLDTIQGLHNVVTKLEGSLKNPMLLPENRFVLENAWHRGNDTLTRMNGLMDIEKYTFSYKP